MYKEVQVELSIVHRKSTRRVETKVGKEEKSRGNKIAVSALSLVIPTSYLHVILSVTIRIT